jgi:hypothetical protein
MKINLGCGKDIRKDMTNVDKRKWDGVDHVMDLRDWDLPDDSAEYILASQILEHFAPGDDLFTVMHNLWKTLKSGGKLEAYVPNANKSIYTFLPDHLSYWTPIFVYALVDANEYQSGDFKFEVELLEELDNRNGQEGNSDIHFILRKK